MNQTARSFLALTKASLKMYYRNKGAIVFTLLLPVALMSIFGFLSQGRGSSLKVGFTNYSHSALSTRFVETIKKVKVFDVVELTEAEAARELGKGNLELQVIVPGNFGTLTNGKPVASHIQTRFNKARPQSGQIANLAIVQIVSGLDKEFTQSPTLLDVNSEGNTTNNLGYFDFVLP
jgi:hypothetical protein